MLIGPTNIVQDPGVMIGKEALCGEEMRIIEPRN